MATAHRVQFIFEFGNTGWSEVWYRQANDPVAATLFDGGDLSRYCFLRGAGVTLRAIRGNDTGTARRSYLRIINFTNGVDGHAAVNDAEPAQVAVLAYCTADGFNRRPLLLRGISDALVARTIGGQPIFSAQFITAWNFFRTAVLNMRLQMRYIDNSAPAGTPRPIVQLAPGAGSTGTAIQYTGAAPVDGSRIIIHGLSRKIWPGFQGPLPWSNPGAGTLTVPVRWPLTVTSAQGGTATFIQFAPNYANLTNLIYEDFRSHKVGRPSLLSRGRRPAVTYRSR